MRGRGLGGCKGVYLAGGAVVEDAEVFPAVLPEGDAVGYGPGVEIVEGL